MTNSILATASELTSLTKSWPRPSTTGKCHVPIWKLRQSLEEANVTTWQDLMDPSGI
ncbi:hypothetical protein F441_07676 [Phytophthora nicotianae CJ01A1]|uniref:Uncharacterized protein n=2 Tax=Phytophthora nicotianae TaxID=4792 RepID=V9EDL8_PHYNI|nr:hypothetical protein F443_16981 [Phytophthora nicotianae P1569]ETP18053.1 hypothetical protein F441_07676 [Phytophthora nicotianae CJ01A1]